MKRRMHRMAKLVFLLPVVRKWRQSLVDNGLWSHKRILFVNWIFQRILGINGDCRWSVNYTSRVNFPENIKIAEGVKKSFAVSIGCYFQGYNGIHIEEGSIFGPGVRLLSANHEIGGLSRKAPPIKIGRNCWLGANVIVLPGVVIGDNTIVAAGAVVTKSFPDGNAVIGGVPAKILRTIPS